MKRYSMQLCILIPYIITNATLPMETCQIVPNVRVFVKNLSTGLMNYDIYVQILPTLSASQKKYEEVLIPYGETKIIGMLARIQDIKTRGSTSISGWTYNEDYLNKIKKEVEHKAISGGHLLLLIEAGTVGFYISYYNWVPDCVKYAEL